MSKLLIGIFLALIWLGVASVDSFTLPQASADGEIVDADQQLADAYQNQRSDIQIQVNAIVSKLLADDDRGSRHQRFIVRLNSGQTLLVAHNIDLAPRINDLSEGDSLELYGEYEWSNKGGVMHWTHRDPSGRHVGGWIKHAGQVYQ
ncbi:MAG: DUF3465 domain-containing protein [Methylomonas lenta]|nr:DUF3465 domain-containing protein [Methylomonas lenta]